MDSSSHTNNVVLEQQQQHINNDANLGVPTTEQAKLTPEQEEEIKLRIKYPNPQKPGGSAFIQKMLHRGSKKYFDSGDYNMAKSKIKSLNNNQINNINNTTANTTTAATNTNSLCTTTNQTCNNQVILENASVQLNQSPVVNELSSPSIVIEVSTPSIKEPNRSLLQTPTTITTINSNNSSPSIPNSASVNHIPNSSSLGANYQGAPQSLSSSVSASSIHMLSSSISTDKLSNIHINTSNPTSMLDSEEIGHGIPTPECLPQSRKHSIVQSKLATPRLSSS
jgi:hypothetical protein